MELLSLFYIFVDALLLVLFGVCCWRRSWWSLAVVVGFAAHPLLTEPALKLVYTGVYRARGAARPGDYSAQVAASAAPVVYDPRYNIEFFGLEDRHSFDSKKYRRALAALAAEGGYATIASGDPDYAFIYAHTGLKHLVLLNYALYFSKIAELNVCFVPASLLRWFALRRFLYAAQGTLTATDVALQAGFAINLGGGFHHAHARGGSGFCFYNDIGLALARLLRGPAPAARRVMVVDLDAHQGNGHARDKLALPGEAIFILDAFNPAIFPRDAAAKRAIDRQVLVDGDMDDAAYLAAVSAALEESLQAFRPDFVIYNAGTDIMAGDRLGRLAISRAGIIARDEMVVGKVRGRGVPMVMLLSGGYQKTNAGVMAESIASLNRKFYPNSLAAAPLFAEEDEHFSAAAHLLSQR